MSTRRIAPVLALSVGAMALSMVASPASGAAPRSADADVIPGSYIVGFRPPVDKPGSLSDQLEKVMGFLTRLRYRHALAGFAAALTPEQVDRIRRHPLVAFVVPDREVEAVATVPLQPGDVGPTGIRRFEAASADETHEASSVNVAVIDTGIDLNHTDLDNAVNGKDCTGSEPAQDDNGHGTHVAGTIAAENDGSGVVGAAPGTKLYAVKVLNSSGSGSWSQVICGIDWVTSTRTDRDANGNLDPTNDIAVANMSLGGGGSALQTCATTSDALHKAICNSTAAGVTYVVAAGNSGWDFDYAPAPDVPAAYPEVLTVTAVSDSDGLPDGLGGAPTCRSGEVDDRYASFSNYAATSTGQAHTVAGPGVCITSDWVGGGTKTISGTSMATPHITGLVALCLEEPAPQGCGGSSPLDVIQKVRSDAEAFNTDSNTDSNTGYYGFTGDPLLPLSGRYYGYLAHVGMGPLPPPPPPPVPDGVPPSVDPVSLAPADGALGITPTANVSVSFSEPMDRTVTQSAFSLAPPSGTAIQGSFSWNGTGSTMTFDPAASLAAGTWYTATVGATATDATGEQLGAPSSWSFHTLTNVTASPGGTTIEPGGGTLKSGTYTRLATDNGSYYEVNSTTSGTRITSWYGSFFNVSNDLSGLKVTYRGRNSRSCTQTMSIWSWTGAGSWIQLDSRSVGTSEVLVEKTPTGTLADYVSGNPGQEGELRVRIRCTRSSGSFYARGDLMGIAYTRP